MKKTFLSITLLMILTLVLGSNGVSAAESSHNRFSVVASGNYYSAWDFNLRDIYGAGQFNPEVKVRAKLYKELFFWAGYGFTKDKYTLTYLEQETKFTHHFFSGGAGYMMNIAGNLDFVVELGLFKVDYKEEAMGVAQKGSATGFRLDNGIIYRLSKRLFLEFSLAFLTATENEEMYRLRLGGIKTGIGLGIRF